jgi:hypothetical protein
MAAAEFSRQGSTATFYGMRPLSRTIHEDIRMELGDTFSIERMQDAFRRRGSMRTEQLFELLRIETNGLSRSQRLLHRAISKPDDALLSGAGLTLSDFSIVFY